MIRVLIVEDHPLVRIGISALLHQQAQIEVVGECAEMDRALTLTVERQPDLVLLGLRSPGASVADATRELVNRRPGVRVIVLAAHPARLAAGMVATAGAAAYLPNTGNPAELVQTIRTVAGSEPERPT